MPHLADVREISGLISHTSGDAFPHSHAARAAQQADHEAATSHAPLHVCVLYVPLSLS